MSDAAWYPVSIEGWPASRGPESVNPRCPDADDEPGARRRDADCDERLLRHVLLEFASVALDDRERARDDAAPYWPEPSDNHGDPANDPMVPPRDERTWPAIRYTADPPRTPAPPTWDAPSGPDPSQDAPGRRAPAIEGPAACGRAEGTGPYRRNSRWPGPPRPTR